MIEYTRDEHSRRERQPYSNTSKWTGKGFQRDLGNLKNTQYLRMIKPSSKIMLNQMTQRKMALFMEAILDRSPNVVKVT